MKYVIPYANLTSFTTKMASIETKCAELGLDFSCVYGDIFMQNIDENDEGKGQVKCIEVDVEGTAKVEGYEFLASIEHHSNGNIINSLSSEPLDVKWRSMEAKCDHCGKSVGRKNTYLVRNTETGEIKQLGKSCLKLYTGGLSADHVAFYESFLKTLDDYDMSSFDPDRMPKNWSPMWNTLLVLGMAIKSVDNCGYIKSGNNNSTKNDVINRLHELRKEPLEDMYMERAKEEKEYIMGMSSYSDYIYNLQTLLKDIDTDEKHFGYICSIPATYNREKEKEAEKRAKEEAQAKEGEVSDWMGSVGEQMTATIVSFETVASFENAYGFASLIKMVTDDGNQLKWTTSSFPEYGEIVKPHVRNGEDTYVRTGYITMEELLPCKVQFRVKSHDEYKGTKQTTVIRVKPVKGEVEKKFTKTIWHLHGEDVEVWLRK